MNDVQWNLSITMNPLQLSTPRTAFESYLKPLMNKYIPDLKGILIQVDHQTLMVKSSHEFDKSDKVGTSCIIQFHPIYPSAKDWHSLMPAGSQRFDPDFGELLYNNTILAEVIVTKSTVNFVVSATILCPTVGQQVDADVRVVKFGRLVCRFGDKYSIFVTVPTCGEEAIDTIPVDPQTGEPLKLFVGDKVRLEITHVNLSAAGDVLRLSGRVLSVISRSEFSQKKIQSRNKTAAKQAAVESIEQENAEEAQEKVSKKRKKPKKHLEEQQQPQETPEETELERPKKKKKRKSEVPVPPESSEMEAESMPPKRKDKKSHRVKMKKHSGDGLLAVKRDPDEAVNEPGEQEEESFFQVPDLMNPPVKGDPTLATGMESPDIFSSEDEEETPRQNLLKKDVH
ncbi:hypothetical protein ACTXT7_006149 [Hymenolepis weldensis]